MSSEGWITCRWGQDGYGLLIRNYPVTLSLWHCLVKIIPHIHLLKAFSLRYRHFFGGARFWLHGSELTWKTMWQQSSIAPKLLYSQHLLQGTSMHAAVKTCCFMTGTFCFFLSLALSFLSLSVHPTTANLLLPITLLTMPSAQPHSAIWNKAACLFTPVKPPLCSHLTAKFYWKLEIYRPRIFCRFSSSRVLLPRNRWQI